MKILVLILLIGVLFLGFGEVFAQTETDTSYKFLAPLPGFDFINLAGNSCPFGKYISTFFSLFLGIIALLAFLMIVIGGIEYMTSESISGKGAGKERIQNAILGLLIALASWLILETINPKLLDVCLKNLPQALVEIGPGPEGIGGTPINKSGLQAMGIFCPESGGASNLLQIANSFVGKVTYSNSQRFTIDTSIPTVYLDCSSFVKQIYKCAGLDFAGDRTASMFQGAEKITSIQGNNVNGQPMQLGNILGWMPGESTKYPSFGHAVMYIGGGQFIEVHGGSSTNKAVSIRSINAYLNEYKHILRLP